VTREDLQYPLVCLNFLRVSNRGELTFLVPKRVKMSNNVKPDKVHDRASLSTPVLGSWSTTVLPWARPCVLMGIQFLLLSSP